MNHTLVVRAFALVVLLPAAAFSAPRAFVKSTGSDANPCSLAAPCRNFTAAVAAVDAGGEVVALDSAGYGPITITKAVTVSAPLGAYAGVTATSGNAVTVAAGASDVVVLRGLSLNGAGADYGINFIAGAALYVESCVITGFAIDGLVVNFASKLFIKDTEVRNCETGGVRAFTFSGTTQVSIENSRFENNGACGVTAGGGPRSLYTTARRRVEGTASAPSEPPSSTCAGSWLRTTSPPACTAADPRAKFGSRMRWSQAMATVSCNPTIACSSLSATTWWTGTWGT